MKSLVKKIVVVGGGFAGVNIVKKLWKDKRFRITMVDQDNYHFFPPLLYQVATAFIEPSNICYPFRRMFTEKNNVRFHYGTLLKVNPESNTIETGTGSLEYDYLVLALGAETNYFGMENVRQHALPMKSVEDAINLRNHLLLDLERAVITTDSEEREKLLNIVIAGGGPSGVEIAGMLAEMGHTIVSKEYPEIKRGNSRIHLIDASPHLLGPMSTKAQKAAEKVLSELGVQVKLNRTVKDYRDGRVYMADGESILTDSLIWTSGVVARKVPGISAEQLGHAGRILVNEYNKVKNSENIFAIGDICLQTTDKNYPKGHPQLAQVAIQQGKILGENLLRMVSNENWKPFNYDNKGSMAIISKYEAVADLPRFSFTGFFAWLIWLFVHIIPLVGFRNKVRLAFSWFWSFITNNPTLRLIIRPKKQIDHL
ncbi:MAG: NAD(P)/FAD-dependent oxidoreductase [Ginsengibacter sp.]